MSLVLKGVDYGPVQCASGAMGWFGEGYWYHRYVPGLSWKGCTFVAKTTTLRAREGNTPFHPNPLGIGFYKPKELIPRSVIVRMREGIVLNSVGLSGPGSEALLLTQHWQKLDQPFFLSFMSVAPTQEERYNETCAFIEQMILKHDEFAAPFGIQVNLSCPNTGHDTAKIAGEAKEILQLFESLRDLGIPIVPKLNVLYPIEAVAEIEPFCDAICISNTLPWGTLPADVDWAGLFPNKPGDELESLDQSYNPISDSWAVNPLSRRGIKGGGLSGWPLLPLVEEWVKAARGRGIDLPINAGGGVLKPDDVDVLAKAGADSVFMGSIAILRGWRLRKTIQRAHSLFG
jgi:dihydroorotate dehydrogenase